MHLQLVLDASGIHWDSTSSYFEVTTRTYKKTGSAVEVAFMHWLLPEKAKFTPAVRP
jgi:hypothetical protein